MDTNTTQDEGSLGSEMIEYAPSTNGNLAPKGVAGVDGESYQSYGYIYAGGDDPNFELAGRLKYPIYNTMRRSDPAIRSLLWMWKLPIRAGKWSVEPAGNGKDPTDRLVADALRRQFGLDGHDGRLDLSWDDSVAQALLMLDWGAEFEELIWGDPEEWRDDEGTARVWRPLVQLGPRSPATIHKINQAQGRIESVEQDLPNAKPIPGHKLAWYVLEKEGSNFFGTSALRACFGPWKLKKSMMIAAGIAFDRYAGGTPKVRYPQGGGDSDRLKAEKIGMNLRVHERGWVALPGVAADGWDVEIMNGSGTIANPVPLLQHYDQQIQMNGMQQFSGLGTSATGSRAVGDTLSAPYWMAVEAIADTIKDARRRQVWRTWIDVNFGSAYDLPLLKVTGMQAKSIDTMAAALANLSSAGFSFADLEAQNNIRDRLDLPRLPEGTQAALATLPADVGIAVEGAPLGL